MSTRDLTAPRILLIRRRYLGDVLLLSAVTAGLRAKWPEAEIRVACDQRYAQAADLLPGVNGVLRISEGWSDAWRLFRQLRRARFSHVMDYDNRWRTAWLVGVSGAADRVAFPIGRAKRTGRFCYTRFLEMPGEIYARQHMSENYAWAWKEIGSELPEARHRLVVPPAFSREAGERIAGSAWSLTSRDHRLLVHVGTRSEARRWPMENFAAALGRLAAGEHGWKTAVVGGPGDEAALESLQRLCPEVTSLGVLRDARMLAAVMENASFFVGHDSGPAHLAAGLGLKVVTLATAPELTQWRPLAKDVLVIAAPNPCPRCLAPGTCVKGDSYRMCCIRHVSSAQLVEAVRSLT